MSYPHSDPAPTEGATTGAPAPPSVLEHCLVLIRRRWQLVLGVWMAVMMLTVMVLWLLPRQYQSQATFLVKNVRQELLVGPGDAATAAYRDDIPEEIMNTEMELLRSREIIAQVVRELDLDRGYLEQGIDDAEASERAIRDLGSGLVAETLRNTNLIRISYTSPDPKMSRDVLQHVAQAYLIAHVEVHSSPGTHELFRQQAEDAGRQLNQAQHELAAIAHTTTLVLPEEQTKEILTSISGMETEYAALTASMKEMASRVRAAERKMMQVPQRIQMQVRNVPNQYSTERLNTLIVELTNKRTTLLTKFTPDDRLVQEIDQQIRDTTAALGRAQGLSADEQTTSINPSWQALETESLTSQLTLAGYAEKATQIRSNLETYRRRAFELAEAAPTYDVLSRQVGEARVKWELYTKKQEEARIAETLDQQRISNVVLAQPPFVSHVPTEPDVRFGLLAGFATATILAAFAALMAEQIVAAFGLIRSRRISAGVVDDDSTPATALS